MSEEKKGLIEKLKFRWDSAKQSFDRAFEQRDRNYVTLEMRNRGDYAGKFSIAKKTWRHGLQTAVVSFPVISRALRSNTSTSVSTDIKLNHQASTEHPAKRNAVEIIKSIYAFEEPRLWTEELEIAHAHLAQLGGFSVLEISDDEKTKTTYQEPKVKANVDLIRDQIATCTNCGENYYPHELGLANQNQNGINGFTHEMVAEMRSRNIPDEDILNSYKPKYELGGEEVCKKCGKPGMISLVGEPETGFVDLPDDEDLEDFNDYLSKIDIFSALLWRFDTVSSIGFKYKNAEWFNTHYPVSKSKLKAKYKKHAKLIDSYSFDKWSHSFKWYFDLGKPNLGQTESYTQHDERQWFAEVDRVIFKACMFEGEIANDEDTFEIGEKKITVKKNECYADVFRQHVEDFDGLEIYFLDKEILEIGFWEEEKIVHVLIPWRLNPTSSVPNGEERLQRLQDQVTNCLSMEYQNVVRETNAILTANSRYYEKSDLTRNIPGQVAMTKEDLEDGQNVTNHIAWVSPPPRDGSNMTFVQLLIDVSKEESGVFDETVGSTDPSNETLGGRNLAINRSLSLLGPTQKSKKHGKIEVFKEIYKRWQRKPDAAFKMLRGVYEDSITPADIDDFKNFNIDSELRITEVQGSDVPKNAPDQFNLYQIAVSWGLFQKESPLPLEYRQYILRSVLGLPIDLENYEADRRIAADRVLLIQGIIERKKQELGDQPILTQMKDQFGKVTTQLVPDVLTAIEVDPQTQITIHDNHLVLMDYYNNQLKGLKVSRSFNQELVLALEAQIVGHEQMAANLAMQKQAEMAIRANAAAVASDPNMMPNGQQPMQPNGQEVSQTTN